MFSLGIGPVSVSELNSAWMEIFEILTFESQAPEEVWAVYYLGKIIAIYLTSDEAYAALKAVMQLLDTDHAPRIQGRLDAIDTWDKAKKAHAKNTVQVGSQVKLTV
ncbi:hypothetical protein M2397_000515 [Pseudomonas sp. BIGb0381]|uniref:hypothetical protein n=1 Tax=Pseudomonas sp. BIGb0381 TaxID=2940608 RepID=UPI002168780D|nr:hypothetical protein [Pseudomonas sp. BIGb0381]MCS4310240.1 hypothetical protein [Pseudomonas sp. BIGb0381]